MLSSTCNLRQWPLHPQITRRLYCIGDYGLVDDRTRRCTPPSLITRRISRVRVRNSRLRENKLIRCLRRRDYWRPSGRRCWGCGVCRPPSASFRGGRPRTYLPPPFPPETPPSHHLACGRRSVRGVGYKRNRMTRTSAAQEHREDISSPSLERG